MTVLYKDEKFVDVISGSISIHFYCEDGGSWKGDMSNVYYCLYIIARKPGLFSDFDTFHSGFMTRDLMEAYSVLQAMLAAKDSGVEVWEVPGL